jgi:integrase
MQAKISAKTVGKLRPGGVISDTEIRGFSARCWPSGRISYDLRYRTPRGERRRLSIGLHGTITPDEARTLAKKRAGEVADDRDPVAERKVANATSANTVNAILDNYVARVLGNKRSKPGQVSAFDRLVRPQIGTRSIYDLTRADMAKLFDHIDDSSGPVMADRTLAYLRKAFHWQQARDQNFLSPIVKGMTRTSTKERARSRTLTDDEVRAIWKATEGQGAFHALIRFLLLTAARRSEGAAMIWTEVDGSDWTLPAARNKTKVELVRPLSGAAQAVLAALPKTCRYVFTTDGKTPISGFSKFKGQLDQQSRVTGWTPHDLRRTARTLMSRAAVNSDHAELCLGHVITGVKGTYDRHAYHAEKREAFEALARTLRSIVSPNRPQAEKK